MPVHPGGAHISAASHRPSAAAAVAPGAAAGAPPVCVAQGSRWGQAQQLAHLRRGSTGAAACKQHAPRRLHPWRRRCARPAPGRRGGGSGGVDGWRRACKPAALPLIAGVMGPWTEMRNWEGVASLLGRRGASSLCRQPSSCTPPGSTTTATMTSEAELGGKKSARSAAMEQLAGAEEDAHTRSAPAARGSRPARPWCSLAPPPRSLAPPSSGSVSGAGLLLQAAVRSAHVGGLPPMNWVGA